MFPTRRIRLGTRASILARWQADWVSARLTELGIEVEMVPISTSGDQQQQGPIGAMGGQGVFTKEIQRALLDDRIDLAVHSLKDLPTEEIPGLCLAVVPERAPVADVLISRKWPSLEELPQGAVIGTGSFRRRSQLLNAREDLVTRDIRGNVETRIQKLDSGDYDAILLAEAGLRRLGMDAEITQVLPLDRFLPAIGQGALGLETRSDDSDTRSAVEQLNHPASHVAVLAERSMLLTLRGGCLAPVAAWGRIEDEKLLLTGRVLSLDGKQKIELADSANPDAAVELGRGIAEALIAQGATELIQAARDGA